jgi:hypothetical protein
LLARSIASAGDSKRVIRRAASTFIPSFTDSRMRSRRSGARLPATMWTNEGGTERAATNR